MSTTVYRKLRGRRRYIDACVGIITAGLILAACSSPSPVSVEATTTASTGCPRDLPADELCVSGPEGGVNGVLEEVGGPAPGIPRPVAGTVVFTGGGGTKSRVVVGSSGRFNANLSKGTYSVTGRHGDHNLPCRASTIHVDGLSHVNLLVVCPIR